MNTAYRINAELGADVGVTVFTLHPGDIIFLKDGYIDSFTYQSCKYISHSHLLKNIFTEHSSSHEDDQPELDMTNFKITSPRARTKMTLCVNGYSWNTFDRLLKDNLVTDITKLYNRDKLLEDILNNKYE